MNKSLQSPPSSHPCGRLGNLTGLDTCCISRSPLLLLQSTASYAAVGSLPSSLLSRSVSAQQPQQVQQPAVMGSSHVDQVQRHLAAVLQEAGGTQRMQLPEQQQEPNIQQLAQQQLYDLQHVGISALCSTRPFAYSGERLLVVRLSSGCPLGPQEVAARVSARVSRDAAYISSAPCTATDRLLQLVGPERMTSESTLASMHMPVTARHGWASSSKQRDGVQSLAMAADKPLCTTVAFLAADEPAFEHLLPDAQGDAVWAQQQPDEEAQAAAAEYAELLQRAQRVAGVWQDIQQAAAAAGVCGSSSHLSSLLLLADTFAGVAAQLTLFPLADAESGLPHLALFAAKAVLEIAAARPASLAGLQELDAAGSSAPAAAWAWWVQHGGPHASACHSSNSGSSSNGSSSNGGSQGEDDLADHAEVLAAADRQWLWDIVAAAPFVAVAADCPLPVLQSVGMGPAALAVSFWHRFQASGYMLAVVPSSKHTASIQLSADQLCSMCDRLFSYEAELCCSPLVVRERLASRAGVLLLWVSSTKALDAKQLFKLLPAVKGQQHQVVVDVSTWRPDGEHRHQSLPTATQWDKLAALIRQQLTARRSCKPAALSVDEQQDVDVAPFTSLVQLAVASTDLSAVSLLLDKVDAMTRPAPAAAYQQGDSASGSLPQPAQFARAGSYQPSAELQQLLAGSPQQQQAISAGRLAASPSTVHIYTRVSSAETGVLLSGSVSSQVAACAAAVGQLLCSCSTQPRVALWTEVCSVYAHRPADRLVLNGMLARLQPGDAVVVASPDRVACSEADLCWVVSRLRVRALVGTPAGCV